MPRVKQPDVTPDQCRAALDELNKAMQTAKFDSRHLDINERAHEMIKLQTSPIIKSLLHHLEAAIACAEELENTINDIADYSKKKGSEQ